MSCFTIYALVIGLVLTSIGLTVYYVYIKKET